MSESTSRARIRHFTDAEAMAAAAEDYLLATARDAVQQRGRFSLVLAGGRTPERLYRRLAVSSPDTSPDIPGDSMDTKNLWTATHIFQGDERFVPLDHPASNFRLAAATLLAPGLIPAANIHPANIHPMVSQARDITQAATTYQQQIEQFFAENGATGPNQPGFDLVLLGMGNDGHIASLFPGSPLLAEQSRLVAAITEPTGDPPLPRLTLTLPAINAARRVLLLISGREKQLILAEITDNPKAAVAKYPAALIQPRQELTWLVCP